MNKKLKIGLLLNSYSIYAWEYKMITNIIQSHFSTIELVILNNNHIDAIQKKTFFQKLKSNFGRINKIFINKALKYTYERLIEKFIELPDAGKEINAEPLLKEIQSIKVNTYRKKFSDYFKSDDISTIKQHDLDILIRCGFGILRGDILTSAKYGIWSFHHGDNRINRGGPPGFWESIQSWPETGCILQILTEDLDNGKVLSRSYSSTYNMSIKDNINGSFWKSLSFMTRKIEELYNIGEVEFFKKVDHNNQHPEFYSARLYKQPTNYELAQLVLTKIKEKLFICIQKRWYKHQWILMYDLKNSFSSSLWRYKKIIPPKDRFWADPHIVFEDNTYYIFIEEYLNDTKKGHISLMIMDEKGNYSEPKPVLEEPYHLSYPFIFKYEDEYYLIPESASNKTISLYKCVGFPYKWEFEMYLMENIEAYDTTLLHHEGRWWMFANMVENEGTSSWDELFLFSSDTLLTQHWEPHPLNPIVSDCKRARPAGKLFIENGMLYRPSQNCKSRYGYGFNINNISILNTKDYAECPVSEVKPDWDKKILGTHTFNRCNKLHIIDAVYKRRRIG